MSTTVNGSMLDELIDRITEAVLVKLATRLSEAISPIKVQPVQFKLDPVLDTPRLKSRGIRRTVLSYTADENPQPVPGWSKRFVTTAEIVERLNVSQPTLDYWRQGSGTRRPLPCRVVEHGKTTRITFRTEDVELYLTTYKPELLKRWKKTAVDQEVDALVTAN